MENGQSICNYNTVLGPRIKIPTGTIGQMYKYFVRVNLKARWGHKKNLDGVLQGSLGIHKIIILDIPPGSGGRDNGFYVKNGGKNDISKK